MFIISIIEFVRLIIIKYLKPSSLVRVIHVRCVFYASVIFLAILNTLWMALY